VGGLDELKGWLMGRSAAFSEPARKFGLPAPKGLLLLGVQGCGKSLTAKAIATQWALPLLRLDLGRIFSSLIGSSEENLRRAIRVAESVAPAVLWIDEIEKGFASVVSSESDGGLSRRILGRLLGWMQEREAPVFLVATCNQITSLPPELMRKGRFDEIFFVDLPTLPERKEIFHIHVKRRGRDPAQFNLDLLAEKAEGMTGAEIEQAVVSALFDEYDRRGSAGVLSSEGVVHSLQETVPLSKTMKEKIATLRAWCRTRARPASSSHDTEQRDGGRALDIDQPKGKPA